MLLDRTNSLLLVIDIQERFLPHIHKIERILERTELLLQAAKLFDIPILASEQYPKGLGGTAESLMPYIAPEECLPKMEFSCWRNPALQQKIQDTKKQHVVIAGVETHVCVLQTAIALKEHGYDVFVVADATSSRAKNNVKHALTRMTEHGIHIVNSEMVATEWCQTADHPAFKQISKMIR